MFFLTRESQELFNAAFIYPFEEQFDAEFEEYLYDQLTERVEILPQKFQAGIRERTLFQHKLLMKEFEEWCNATVERQSAESNAIHELREGIAESFHPSAHAIFSQSLHDGKIVNAQQQGDNFTLLLDMSGGFTEASIVELVFHDARTEGELDGYYIYDELVKTEDGFALRVLSSFGSPYMEWTIFFKDATAKCLYRPAIYVEPGEIATWDAYVTALNENDRYYMIEDLHMTEIDLANLSQSEQGIFAGEIVLGDTFEEAKERIYCASYEDPYAEQRVPMPTDELLDAIFDSDPIIRVRAFNTIFALGEEAAAFVNAVLRKAEVGKSEEEDMYFGVMAGHFHQLGCLEDEMKLKWQSE